MRRNRSSAVRRSRLRFRDVAGEAGAAIGRRPGRSLLTALGTVVGVGAFVATTGLASTARAQVGETFDALKATEVRVTDAAPDSDEPNPFPLDTDERVAALNGVNVGGVMWTVDDPALDVRSRATPSPRPSSIPIVAASAGAIAATLPTVSSGRLFDAGHDRRGERVAVVGRAAAAELNIGRVDMFPAVFIGDDAYTVIGLIDDVERNPDVLLSVVIPASTATADLDRTGLEYSVLIDVQPGAAEVVGDQVAVALRPHDEGRLQPVVPPDPETLRRDVESDVTGLLYGLAGLALLVGMIGIANTTLVAVLERRGEIGVRRALGARRVHIAGQFLSESAVLGAVGGVLGTSLGVIAVVAVSAAREWTTTLNPTLVVVAPFLGAATGLLAGLHPAVRAARITPAAALRTQ